MIKGQKDILTIGILTAPLEYWRRKLTIVNGNGSNGANGAPQRPGLVTIGAISWLLNGQNRQGI